MSRLIPDDQADAALLRDLTAALGSGDTDAVNTAFEAVYHACAGSVAFVCGRFLTNDTDIRSVTDDVFVSFFQRVPYIEIESLRAYPWRIPGAGEPGGLMSMGSHRVGHD